MKSLIHLPEGQPVDAAEIRRIIITPQYPMGGKSFWACLPIVTMYILSASAITACFGYLKAATARWMQPWPQRAGSHLCGYTKLQQPTKPDVYDMGEALKQYKEEVFGRGLRNIR